MLGRAHALATNTHAHLKYIYESHCVEGVVRDNEETRKNHSGCQAQSQGLGDILLPFGAYPASAYISLSKSL